jgi:murein DD-endopeptidase MepM/ murein hydrolase activator NlpD
MWDSCPVLRARTQAVSALRLPGLLLLATLVTHPVRAQEGIHRSAPPMRPEVKNIFWQPDDVKQGSPVLISVELSGPATEVNGTFLRKQVRFTPSGQPRVWVALAGADVDQTPGSFEVRVNARMSGRVAHLAKPIEVKEGQFGTGEANVAQDYVNPTPDEERHIARDEVLKKNALGRVTPRPLWNRNFVKPIEADPTASFGESRLMNEEKTSRHLGTDFPAKEGTAVHAANAGVVVLAAPLFYEGNCIIIDHGNRLFTVYMHLGKLRVRRGERVQQHAEIGLSGRTGRVTGPHLHFEVVWNRSHLDPLELLALTLPDRHLHETRKTAR